MHFLQHPLCMISRSYLYLFSTLNNFYLFIWFPRLLWCNLDTRSFCNLLFRAEFSFDKQEPHKHRFSHYVHDFCIYHNSSFYVFLCSCFWRVNASYHWTTLLKVYLFGFTLLAVMRFLHVDIFLQSYYILDICLQLVVRLILVLTLLVLLFTRYLLLNFQNILVANFVYRWLLFEVGVVREIIFLILVRLRIHYFLYNYKCKFLLNYYLFNV